MFKPLPPTGARTLDSRTAFYYGYTLDSPGMIMRIPDVGSQYLMGFLDADGKPFDGAKTYKVTLPKDIPARAFWSFTLYDNQTRSMLDTPQRYPRAGSQSYPSPAAEAGRRRLDDDLLRPDTARGRQARQLDPDRCPARAGSRSSASTARCRRSSTRAGARARSSWSNEPVAPGPTGARSVAEPGRDAADDRDIPPETGGRCDAKSSSRCRNGDAPYVTMGQSRPQ